MSANHHPPLAQQPYGYCQCGCGQPAPIAKQNIRKLGHVKGQPVRFISGHNARRRQPPEPPNKTGLCMCGCGNPAPIARGTNPRYGIVAGQPQRYIHGHNSRAQGDAFEGKWEIVANGCWLYTGRLNAFGYGLFGDRLAHREMWRRRRGPLATTDFLDHLCHDRATCTGGPTCLHRRCVNLEHLAIATNAQNTQRGAKGKLTPDDVREIRASPETNTALARRFGVSDPAISSIRHYRTWKNV